MSNIDELIRTKLKGLASSHDVYELALSALESSDSGLPEPSVADHLESVVRDIVRRREVGR